MDDGFINHYRNSSTYIPVKRPGADMEPNVVDAWKIQAMPLSLDLPMFFFEHRPMLY